MKYSIHSLLYIFFLALPLIFLNPQKGEAQFVRILSEGRAYHGVYSVAFSPDGTKVLSGYKDKTLKLWETSTGKLLRTFSGHDEALKSVAFSPDGTKVLSGSSDRTLKLWETATGKLLRTFSGHDSSVSSVAFSPDGTRVLSGSYDNTLKLLETATGKLLRTFTGHSGGVGSVAFSPDGTKVLSGSYDWDDTVKLWETATGKLLRTFSGIHGYVYSVAFSPDGTKVLAGSFVTLKLWTISPKAFITEVIQKRIQSWQQKGKYESTQAYLQRVTETKRRKLIRQYTTEIVDSLGQAHFDFNIAKTDYDPDNAVFEVTFLDKTSIYVNVPVSQAQAFDRNLSRLRFSDMDFTLTTVGELVLRKAKIYNPANDQIYAYDSGREVAFNTAKLAANLDPIAVQVQTEDVGSNVTKGTKKIEVGKADVDVNIPKTAMSKPDGIAVVIGNRRYQGDTPDVDYAVNDAKVMREYLIKTLGFRPDNILYVENASKSRMEVLLGDDKNQGKLANYLKPGRSDVFVFYSGHGAPDPNTETGYLIPVDGDATVLNITGYPLEVLYDNLAQLDAKSVNVVIDACFSGAGGGGEMLVDKASPIGIEVQNPAAKLDNGFVVTASSGSQISSWYPEKGHGLLTYFWLKALQGEADQNGDQAITASEIRTYLNDNSDGLPYWARRLHNREQTPQVFTNNNKKVIVEYK